MFAYTNEVVMTATAAERQEKYRQKKKSNGFTKVCVWVPEEKREKLITYAEELSKDDVRT